MGESFQYVDIILFAMIAAFLVLRLRSVLGRHKDDGRPPSRPSDRLGDRLQGESRNDPLAQPSSAGDDSVISLPDRVRRPRAENPFDDHPVAGPAGPLDAGVAEMRARDPSFDLKEFLAGARAAFEMIVQGFAEGDRKTLKQLLSAEVYENFDHAMRDRESRNETLENTLIRIVSVDPTEAEVEQGIASLTVKIVSEQVNVTKNASGEVVDGNANHIAEVIDIWTFSRDLRSRDPNWKLIATRSE
jgi:predicted lipid-binding transport protein (Tim44 family)